MGKTRIQASDVMRAPISAVASTIDEVAQLWAQENSAAQAMLGAGVDAATNAAQSTWDFIAGVGESLWDAATGVVDTITDAVTGAASAVQEWWEQDPHSRVIQLYGSLGTSDAFLEALYAEPDATSPAVRRRPRPSASRSPRCSPAAGAPCRGGRSARGAPGTGRACRRRVGSRRSMD